MQSAQEFIECFLREQADLNKASRARLRPFREKFFAQDYLKFYQDWEAVCEKNEEKFSMAEVYDESAQIITTSMIGKRQQRYRYHLRVSAGQWKIFKRENECFACRGGSRGSNETCPVCGGAGWRDYLREAA